ncbi:MAG: HD-GYP domain-containing protein [Syntrophomonas sp.]|nr:HD-GYP domain-containing protein [Syntrophomonas sp.]
MLRISISSLKPGVKLGKDIYSYDGKLLLPKDTVISQDHLDQFMRRNVTDVFIVESTERQQSDKRFEDVYIDCLEYVKALMMQARMGQTLAYKEISDIVDMLMVQVFDQNDLFRQMRIMKNRDEYIFTHSVNVALLCILIGRWMKCEDDTVKQLGIAGILHDIGNMQIPDVILNKPGRLSGEEFEQIKRHPLLGYNMVNEYEWVNESIANAILMHHERADGSGYPLGMKGYKIDFFASVVAVADLYDAITSSRSYSAKASPYTAVEILWQESFGKLDPRIAKVFYDKITNFYVGNEVILSNNERGVVVFVDPSQPTRPIVMCGDKFYNLALERSLSILDMVD